MKYPICEYMQGDWLIPRGKDKPDQVRKVDYQEEMSGAWCVITFQNDRYCHYYPYNCQPIPITPEILEKNDWESLKNGSGDFILTEPMVGNSATITKTINGYNMQYGMFNGLTIQFVHQLQHALRLCGIKKEIEL